MFGIACGLFIPGIIIFIAIPPMLIPGIPLPKK
jgi:hypothetical protein